MARAAVDENSPVGAVALGGGHGQPQPLPGGSRGTNTPPALLSSSDRRVLPTGRSRRKLQATLPLEGPWDSQLPAGEGERTPRWGTENTQHSQELQKCRDKASRPWGSWEVEEPRESEAWKIERKTTFRGEEGACEPPSTRVCGPDHIPATLPSQGLSTCSTRGPWDLNRTF